MPGAVLRRKPGLGLYDGIVERETLAESQKAALLSFGSNDAETLDQGFALVRVRPVGDGGHALLECVGRLKSEFRSCAGTDQHYHLIRITNHLNAGEVSSRSRSR